MTGPAQRTISTFVNTMRSRWQSSLNYRIAYSLILVTVLFALVFGTITVTTIFHFVRAKEAASLQNRLELNSSKLEIFLNAAMSHVENLAQNTIVLNALVDTYGRDSYLIPFLREHRITESFKHRLSLCDFQGTVVASSADTSGAYHDKDLLDKLIGKNRAVAKIIDRGKKTGNDLLICAPVMYRATGTSEGFLVFEASLQDVMKTLGGGDQVSFSIVQQEASAARDEGTSNEVSLRRKLDLQGPLQALDLALEVRTRAASTVLWVASALILATALMIWLAVRISYRISNHLTRRIVLLSQAARRIAESGTPDGKVALSGRDEIEYLAVAFNRMVDRLHASYEELEGRVEERTRLLAETNRNLSTEIEQRYDAEKRLLESERKYRELVENANSVILTLDINGTITFFNKYAEQFFGFRQEEIIGRNVVGTIVPEIESSGRDMAALVREICADPERFKDVENENVTKDGRRVWVQWLNRTVLDATGKPAGILSIGNDMTERRNLLAQLEHLNRNLAERVWEEIGKNRAKEQLLQLQSRHAAMGEMIDNIAHQWRQPLNNLGLVMQGMQKKFNDGSLTRERMQEQAKTGMSLIRYMSQTINDFTNFFRHDKEIVKFRVKDVVTTALSFMETSLKRNAIAVVVDIAEDITIKGYRNEYTQVLVNILNNARDVFVERAVQNPAITIRAFRENGSSVLTIADNGGGIPGELIDKIFTPYFTTKEHNMGTGIGLYMSKTIIENNVNGKLTVRNKQDGAEFRIEVRDGK